jgi:hypothetical protein
VGESDDTLQLGILDDEGHLQWAETGGEEGRLQALSFAGDAFFAIYSYYEQDRDDHIATSYDGVTWTSTEGGAKITTGAVAAVKTGEDSEGRQQYLYVACGEILHVDPDREFANRVDNLAWLTSSNGTDWVSDFNEGGMAEPGTKYNIIANYACTVAGGSETFVAAAAAKTKIHDEIRNKDYAVLTSAPAESAPSTEGALEWNVTKVGIDAGLDQLSWGLAATFIRTAADDGYFLMTDHEIITGEGDSVAIPSSTLYQAAASGGSWSTVKKTNNWMATLSAIAKDLDGTTIVTIT